MLLVLAASCVLGLHAQENSDSSIRVSEIQLIGNMLTKDYVILREMTLKVGDVLTRKAIEHDQQRILDLQLFNKVDIEHTTLGGEAIVHVIVHERWYIFPVPILGFKYRDPKNFYYGIGLAHLNFRGRNEKILFSFALGFDRWIELAYHNPKLTSNDDIFFRSSISSSRLRNLSPSLGFYDQQKFTGNLMLGKRFGLYQSLSAQVGYDLWIVPGDSVERTVSRDGRDAFITLGINYSSDTRDLREYTTRGYSYSVSATKYGLGESDVDFFRLGCSLRGFVPVIADWALGARAYGTFTGGGRIPPYRHVFFGYDERIRGYFRDVFEGENVVGANIELRIPLLKPRYYIFPYAFLPEFSVWRYGLYAGVFADAGKTWFRAEGFSGRKWYSGFGAGLHFLLPYSIIVRTEYAFNGNGAGQFVLDFGPSF